MELRYTAILFRLLQLIWLCCYYGHTLKRLISVHFLYGFLWNGCYPVVNGAFHLIECTQQPF